jgi:PPOX class probable F420-dependent enzyme
MAPTFEDVRRLAAAETGLAVLATTRPDGSVHATVVNAGPLTDPITSQPSVGVVVRGDARKLDHLHRTGHATLTFRRGWNWVSLDGPVRIISPGAPNIDVPALLRAIFTAAGGTHEDWAEFDRVMAAEKRVAVLVEPTRITGNG